MKLKLIFAAAVFQILAVIAMLAYAYAPIYFGKEILLQTTLYDPRDMFRGDYVHLSYGFAGIYELDKRDSNLSKRQQLHGSKIYAILKQDKDGKLKVKPSNGLINIFEKEITANNIKDIEIKNDEGEKVYVIEGMKENCLIEATIEFGEGSRAFGIGLRQDKDFANGYYLRFEPFYNRIVADMWPRRISGVNQWYVDGDKPFMVELERPFDYKALKENKVNIKVFVEGSIICLYVNDTVALTMRAYSTERKYWGFFVKDGSIRVCDIHMYETK